MITVYGIKNCDTMKKTFAWLDSNGIQYDFHDYKKSGIDANTLEKAIADHGWDTVINKRGTTWRKLPDEKKENVNNSNALDLASSTPSIIKRPLVKHDNDITIGFDTEKYSRIFLK